MNRRELFGAMAATAAVAALPMLTYTAVPYPHVYLARAERVESTMHWLETWRHATDPSWVRLLPVADKDILDGFPYEERYDIVNELYLWERDREAA